MRGTKESKIYKHCLKCRRHRWHRVRLVKGKIVLHKSVKCETCGYETVRS